MIQRMGHLPAGMELFPSDNSHSWDVITKVIDQSDYYILIIGGRYGSTTNEGISYTEKEYDYAFEKEIPILAFFHKDPDQLPAKFVESKAKEKLDAFRSKVEERHHRTTWKTQHDLQSAIAVSLGQQTNINPQVGWIRGDVGQKNTELLQRLDDLQKRYERVQSVNNDLEERVALLQNNQVDDTEAFFQGNDIVSLPVELPQQNKGEELVVDELEVTWDQVLSIVAPHLIGRKSGGEVKGILQDGLRELKPVGLSGEKWNKISDECITKIRNQYMALKLIQVTVEEKEMEALKGTPFRRSFRADYWCLTERGNRKMVEAVAERR